jgi:hypothetical protein
MFQHLLLLNSNPRIRELERIWKEALMV